MGTANIQLFRFKKKHFSNHLYFFKSENLDKTTALREALNSNTIYISYSIEVNSYFCEYVWLSISIIRGSPSFLFENHTLLD